MTVLNTIEKSLKTRFPKDVANLILDFCDVFDIVEKKSFMNKIIDTGYGLFLCSTFEPRTEEYYKEEIRIWIEPHRRTAGPGILGGVPQIPHATYGIDGYYFTDAREWRRFLSWFRDIERDVLSGDFVFTN
jgi:hypothetical protein